MLVLHRRRETHHSWLQFRAMITKVRPSCATRLGPNMWQIEGAFKEYPEGKLGRFMRHEDARVRGHCREWG